MYSQYGEKMGGGCGGGSVHIEEGERFRRHAMSRGLIVSVYNMRADLVWF